MYKISIIVLIVNLILNITYAVDSRGVSYYNQYIWPFVFQKKKTDIVDVLWENKEEAYIYMIMTRNTIYKEIHS